MVKKVFSIVLILACLFMLVAGAFGIKDILQEKSDGEKNKAETLEKLDTLKAGVAELEKNRAAYEEGLKAYEEGTAEYEQGQKDLEAGEADYEAGKIKIANGKVALAAGQKEYDTSLAQYNYTVNNRDTVIDQKTEEYIKANPAVVNGLIEKNLDTGIETAVKQQSEAIVQQKLAEFKAANPEAAKDEATMKAVEAQIRASVEAQHDAIKAGVMANDEAMAKIRAGVEAQVKAGIREQVAAQVDAGIADAKVKLAAGKAKLDKSKAELRAGEAALAAAEKQLAEGKDKLSAAEDQLADGKTQLETFEAGQKQIDAGYATLMENEKIAAKVENGMDALDAGYAVVDEESEITTADLVGRAVYIGLGMLGALFGLIAAFVKLPKCKVFGAIALVLAVAGNVVGLIRTYSEQQLPMIALIVLAVAAILFFFTRGKAEA